METTPRLRPGQAALLDVAGLDEALKLTVEVVQDDRITLASEERIPETVAEGSLVHLTYLDSTGVYTFDAPVARRGATTVAIGAPAQADRVQRRSFVRIDTGPDAACLLLDPASNRFTPFDAEVRDLSGGGVCLDADVIAPEGATVVLSLALPEQAPVVAVGQILPADVSRDRDGRRHLRVQFTLIAEPDRDRVMGFIFSALRAHRAV